MAAAKLKFYSAYNYPVGKFESKCPKEVTDYQYDPSTDKIVECGKTPFYERIQSHADSCRLDRKIAQYQLGNTLALGVPGGSYGDFSNSPDDLAQVLEARDNAKQQFEQLPEAIRNIFGGSYSEFAKSLQDGSYSGKLQQYATTQLQKLASSGVTNGNSSAPGQTEPVNGGN